MITWEECGHTGRAGDVAAALIAECDTFDFGALGDDPLVALQEYDEVAVSIEENLRPGGCGGGGYYRPDPPTIHLHRATGRRDNFTVLHELGHHVQQRHSAWSWVLMDIPPDERRSVEEAVANHFAAQILMPVSQDDRDASAHHPADVMAGIFARTTASRAAALQRVREMLPRRSRWMLAVSELDGVVTTSCSSYDDPQPPTGFAQSGFRQIADEASEGPVRREFHEGIEYRTGSVLDGMRIEAALDFEERYLFVALRPTAVNGTGTWTYPEQECSNPGCGSFFATQDSTGRCGTCLDYKCPVCRLCGCAIMERPAVCGQCNMAFTPAEKASGEHDCW